MSRLEKIHIELTLNHELSLKHEKLIKVFSPPDTREGDTLKLTYDFILEYYGNVVDRFQSIRQLLNDPGVVVGVSLDELKYGESLFIALIDEIRAVQEKLNDRDRV